MIDAKNYCNLPDKPGVYFFYDRDKNLLYIGKARNLKKRVSSYFSTTKKDYKTSLMINKIFYIDYLITNSEVEAILTEQNLISKNQPPYNIQLKDSKSFSVIVITKEEYPAIKLSKQNNKDSGYVFGPYTSVKTAKTLYEFILKNFKLRVCKRKMDRYSKVCLNYHLNLCLAPCERKVSKSEYKKQVKNAINFLNGKYSILLSSLKKEIENASKKLDFERAKDLRDKYEAIQKFKNSIKIKYNFEEKTDFISFYVRKNNGIITLLKVEERKKVFSLTKKFSFIGSVLENLPSILISFYSQLQEMANFTVPDVIYLPLSEIYYEDLILLISKSLSIFFNNKLVNEYDNIKYSNKYTDANDLNNSKNDRDKKDGKNVKINKIEQMYNLDMIMNISDKIVNSGNEKFNIKMNNKNEITNGKKSKIKFKIKTYRKKNELKILEELINHQKIAFKDIYFVPGLKEIKALKELKKILNLDSMPVRIEGFDVSNLDSKIIVGSSVSFFNGIADKSNYRQYNLRSVEFQNDIESINEIVTRRMLQYLNSGNELPDLLLIDGGKPQVNKINETLNFLNINVKVIGLAKKEETIVLPGKNESINLSITCPALRLLIKIRDEAHRFSNRYRKMKIKKELI